ncbi:MAG: hypothetical protein SFU98_02525 [Leptospiraceae bacterium]|nr:hypothetical protein [Leptospiraceae bacterium]
MIEYSLKILSLLLFVFSLMFCLKKRKHTTIFAPSETQSSFSIDSKENTKEFTFKGKRVGSISFSHDSKLLAIGIWTNGIEKDLKSIKIFSLEEDRIIEELETGVLDPHYLKFKKNGELIAALKGGIIRIYDNKLKKRKDFFSNEGSEIVYNTNYLDYSEYLQLYFIKTDVGLYRSIKSIKDENGNAPNFYTNLIEGLFHASFSNDGKLMAVYNISLKVIDTEQDKILSSIDLASVYSVIKFDYESKLIAAISKKPTNDLFIYSINDLKIVKKFGNGKTISHFDFFKNESKIAIAYFDGVIDIIDVNSEKVIISENYSRTANYFYFDISHDGKYLAATNFMIGHPLLLWKLK